MNRTIKRITAMMLIVAFAATMSSDRNMAPASAASSETSELIDGTYVEDELLVVFEEGVKDAEMEKVAKKLDAESIEPIETDETDGFVSNESEGSPCLVTLPKGETVEEALEAYEKNPKVAYAQPNYLYTYYGGNRDANADQNDNDNINKQAVARTSAATYDDTDLWNLKKIDAQEAWDLIDEIKAERKEAGKTDLEKVTVAVLDTGVNVNHEDLQENLNKNKCFRIEGQEPHPDGAYPTLEQQKDTYKLDDGGHGTKVSGIIGATSGNGMGAAGVAAGNHNDMVEVAVLDVYERHNGSDDRLARSSDLVKGIEYAIGPFVGAKVINMSLGHYPNLYDEAANYYFAEDDVLLQSTMKRAIDEKNVTIVCSAGNNGDTELWYPSDFPEAISVINTKDYANVFKQCKASGSNYGWNKDISAPGYQVKTLMSNGGYNESSSGTSFAAPVVAAVAAMIYYVCPDTLVATTPDEAMAAPSSSASSVDAADTGESTATSAIAAAYEVQEYGIASSQVEAILKATATDLYTAGDDIYTRCGNVNAYAAVAKAAGKKTETQPSPLSAPALKAKSAAYNKIRLTWNKTAGAQGYRIYRSQSKNGSYSHIKTLYGKGKTAFTNGNLKTNKTYYYKIRSIGTVDDKRSHSALSEPVAGTPLLSNVTGLKAKSASYRSIQLSWKKTSGADGYRLFRSTSKNGTYRPVKTLAGNGKTSYGDKTKLAAGKTYYYKAKPYIRISGKKTYGKTFSAVKSAKARPKTPSLTVSKYASDSGKRKVRVKWSSVAKVTGYRISRSSVSAKKGFKTIASCSSKEAHKFIDAKVKKKKTYYYKIRAYKKVKGKNVYSAYSAVKQIKP